MEAETVDTSEWPEFVVVRSDHLRVKKVEHEVVEWDASFCSEDAIDVPDLIEAQAAEIERLTADLADARRFIQGQTQIIRDEQKRAMT